jgi:single-stranded DNA-binding protein
MARNNACQHVVDITGNIHFGMVTLGGKPVPFLRMFGFVKATGGAPGVEGLRFVAYGPLAELIYAHVKKGSRLFIISHVQRRTVETRELVEFVVEECQFLRNIDWAAGEAKRQELVDRGVLRPSYEEHDDHVSGTGEETEV